MYLSRPSPVERSGAAALTGSVTVALLGAVVALARLGDPVHSAERAMRVFDAIEVATADAAAAATALPGAAEQRWRQAPALAPAAAPADAPAAAAARPLPDPPRLPETESSAEADVLAPPPPVPPRAEGRMAPLAGPAAPGPSVATPAAEAAPRTPGANTAASPAAAPADGYGRLVFREIHARQTFPAELARAGLAGTVVVELRVSARGRIIAAGVFLSSRIRQLDLLAVAQVLATPLPAPPQGQARTFRIPMRYQAD